MQSNFIMSQQIYGSLQCVITYNKYFITQKFKSILKKLKILKYFFQRRNQHLILIQIFEDFPK